MNRRELDWPRVRVGDEILVEWRGQYANVPGTTFPQKFMVTAIADDGTLDLKPVPIRPAAKRK